MTSHQIDISDYEKDPRLFLFTSLTAGSSHIITATSRMETILKANKIPFQAIDLATDEKARRLWQRRARERKLPGLVKEGFVIGDLDEIEEWNEFGELKENIGNVPSSSGDAAGHTVKTGVNIAPPIPINPTATRGTTNLSQPPINKAPRPGVDESKFRALPGAAEIAARNKPKPATEQAEGKSVGDENAPPKATEGTSVVDEPAPKAVESMTSAPTEKEESINAAKKLLKETHAGKDDHLSAPPSAMQSGTATPAEKEKEGEEPINPAKKLLGEEQATSKDDHLSAPPSATQSGTATPDPEPADAVEKPALETAETGNEEKSVHQDSEVKDVSSEDVKKVEGETSLPEAGEEEKIEGKGMGEEAVAAVEASDAGEGKAAEEIKEQSAKEGEDAGKTVGD